MVQMNNDMSIPMGISRLGFLVSWATVLTASKPKKAKNTMLLRAIRPTNRILPMSLCWQECKEYSFLY